MVLSINSSNIVMQAFSFKDLLANDVNLKFTKMTNKILPVL